MKKIDKFIITRSEDSEGIVIVQFTNPESFVQYNLKDLEMDVDKLTGESILSLKGKIVHSEAIE